jgi:crotonobetainyl-CoA:carnitine CoA-transferase CaiB-like acyl-CoA transferase
VLFSPVYTFAEILAHPHVRQAGILSSLEHPLLGTLPQITPAVVMSNTPGGLNRHPPQLGEHTRQILLEAGFNSEEIDQLISSKVASDAGGGP